MTILKLAHAEDEPCTVTPEKESLRHPFLENIASVIDPLRIEMEKALEQDQREVKIGPRYDLQKLEYTSISPNGADIITHVKGAILVWHKRDNGDVILEANHTTHGKIESITWEGSTARIQMHSGEIKVINGREISSEWHITAYPNHPEPS